MYIRSMHIETSLFRVIGFQEIKLKIHCSSNFMVPIWLKKLQNQLDIVLKENQNYGLFETRKALLYFNQE